MHAQFCHVYLNSFGGDYRWEMSSARRRRVGGVECGWWSHLAFILLLSSNIVCCSEFYYEHWKCNNYLSGETINVRAPSGRLLELHVRDNVQVGRTHLYLLTYLPVNISSYISVKLLTYLPTYLLTYLPTFY